MKCFICVFIFGILSFRVNADIPGYRMLPADGFNWPATIAERKIYGWKEEPIDLKPGERFRVIPLPGGGQGGPIWKIQQEIKPGQWKDITDELFGYGWLAEPHNGWAQLIIMAKCGWREKYWGLLRWNGSTYEGIRGELYDYLLKEVQVSGELPHDPNSYRATVHRIETALRRGIDPNDADDQYMKVIYPDPDFKQPMVCTFISTNDFRLSVLPQARPGDIKVYGVANPVSGDNTLGINCTFAEKVNPELKKRIEKVLKGSFTLLVSNQCGETGETPELMVKLDGMPVIRRKFQSSGISPQYATFPMFPQAGKHKLEVSSDGINFEREFTIDSANDTGILRIGHSPWYKLKRNLQCDFTITRGEP